MNWLGDFLKLIQLNARFLFGIWLFGVILLFLPKDIAEIFGIVELRSSYRPWIGVGALGAFAFWLVQLFSIWTASRNLNAQRGRLIRALESVSGEEWILIAYCVIQNQQSVTLSLVDRIAGSLVARGLLVRADGVGNKFSWPHTIPDFLWNHLIENRGEFLAKAPFAEDEMKARLQGLHEHIHRHNF